MSQASSRAELVLDLRKLVEDRNFLAHHFWFERAHLMFNVEDVKGLIAELDTYGQKFHELDQRVSAWKKPKLQEWGITDEVLADCERRILKGELDEPLPGRRAVQALQKKLARPQTLVRVWQARTDHENSSLIFELSDGTLLQLSDVGLGPTRFQKVDSSWTQHLRINAHLPAEIVLRPKCIGPWDYKFGLAGGVELWVKPGRKKRTFRWGLSPRKMQGSRLNSQ